MTNEKKVSEKFTFKGWSLIQFLKGRKKLLVTAVGGVTAWIVTQNPAVAGLTAAGAELLYALFDYYIKE
jgi:hypothetical protein